MSAPLQLTASALRRELSARGLRHARQHPHEVTYSAVPSVLFQHYELETHECHHGNFLAQSYRAIQANPAWAARLNKTYCAEARIPRRQDPDLARRRRELDCASSSDALLMNIFCHPGILESRPLRALLGLSYDSDPTGMPTFGYKPRLPLGPGRRNRPLLDRTEIDMLLGPLLIEAKLTETSFQRAPIARVQRYPAFEEIFDTEALPITFDAKGSCHIDSYQLVRGVLAAHHEARSFVVLCDARRTDLVERWFQILRTVRLCELRSRLALLTWQEIAAVLPAAMQHFLAEKYGILSA
jgi:restriction endonuclease-like protein